MTVTGRCPTRFRRRCSVTRSVFVIRILKHRFVTITLCETPLHLRNTVSGTPFQASKCRFKPPDRSRLRPARAGRGSANRPSASPAYHDLLLNPHDFDGLLGQNDQKL